MNIEALRPLLATPLALSGRAWHVIRRCACLGVVIAGLLGVAAEAQADLTLTSAATTAGFKLDVFANGFPSSGGIGPLGVAFTSGGGVMVADNASGNLTVFNDVNNQSYNSFVHVGGSYSSSADGLTNDAGTMYLATFLNQQVVALNNDGSLNHVVATNLGNVDGITTDPNNGHLTVSSSNGVLDINPSTGTVTNLSTGPNAYQFSTYTDGLSYSADGKTLYAAVGGNAVQAVDTTTGKRLFSVNISGADGIALGSGTLAGNMFVNTNYGNFYEVNLSNPSSPILLAGGGSRGDFVAVDPNGTLLITQSDSIYRLTAPPGGSFNSVPEPSSLFLVLAAVPFGLLYWRKRRRADSIVIGEPAAA